MLVLRIWSRSESRRSEPIEETMDLILLDGLRIRPRSDLWPPTSAPTFSSFPQPLRWNRTRCFQLTSNPR